MLTLVSVCPGVEIGRQAPLRWVCRKMCWFESSPGHNDIFFYNYLSFHSYCHSLVYLGVHVGYVLYKDRHTIYPYT